MRSTPPPTDPDAVRTRLGSVRRSLLENARAKARAIDDRAAAEADRILDEAVERADAEVDRARHRALESAGARARATLEFDESEAHRHLLETRALCYARFHDALQSATMDLRHHPRYPELLDHLEGLARRQLGDSCTIDRDPSPAGGVLAREGPRRADYTLPVLAERAFRLLGADVEELWR